MSIVGPGWYPDADGPAGSLRWHDGSAWTEYRRGAWDPNAPISAPKKGPSRPGQIPVQGWLAIVFAVFYPIAGLILAIVALRKVKRGFGGRALAIVALVLSILNLVALFFATFWLVWQVLTGLFGGPWLDPVSFWWFTFHGCPIGSDPYSQTCP